MKVKVEFTVDHTRDVQTKVIHTAKDLSRVKEDLQRYFRKTKVLEVLEVDPC